MSAITVVTASVNRASLRRTVESIQAQTLKPVEHCILLSRQAQKRHLSVVTPSAVPLSIRWIPGDLNMVTAYNAACEMADTPLIAILDDDCWLEPNHLESLARLMDETGADFVWASSVLHDEAGKIVGRRDDPIPAFEHIDTNEILFRRECIERWGNHREREADPRFPGLLRGIDGKRIERWVAGGAVYAHSPAFTVHYTWRPNPEF